MHSSMMIVKKKNIGFKQHFPKIIPMLFQTSIDTLSSHMVCSLLFQVQGAKKTRRCSEEIVLYDRPGLVAGLGALKSVDSKK
jgi:hypothetical protein